MKRNVGNCSAIFVFALVVAGIIAVNPATRADAIDDAIGMARDANGAVRGLPTVSIDETEGGKFESMVAKKKGEIMSQILSLSNAEKLANGYPLVPSQEYLKTRAEEEVSPKKSEIVQEAEKINNFIREKKGNLGDALLNEASWVSVQTSYKAAQSASKGVSGGMGGTAEGKSSWQTTMENTGNQTIEKGKELQNKADEFASFAGGIDDNLVQYMKPADIKAQLTQVAEKLKAAANRLIAAGNELIQQAQQASAADSGYASQLGGMGGTQSGGGSENTSGAVSQAFDNSDGAGETSQVPPTPPSPTPEPTATDDNTQTTTPSSSDPTSGTGKSGPASESGVIGVVSTASGTIGVVSDPSESAPKPKPGLNLGGN